MPPQDTDPTPSFGGFGLKLIENKREEYADYTMENFETEVGRHFSIGDRLVLKGGKREMFLLEPASRSRTTLTIGK